MVHDLDFENIYIYDVTTLFLFVPAQGEQQRMAAHLFHFLSAACGFLCAQHVCGSGGGEFPQMS